MIDDLRRRSPAEVFEDHLRLAGEHRFEEDIQRNVRLTSLFSNVEAFSEATMALGSLRGYWSRSCPEHLTSIRTVW